VSLPIARLERIEDQSSRDSGHLERLIRDGIVSPARRKRPVDGLSRPAVSCGGEAIEILIDQRGSR
jgi:hypothetical protein